MWTAVDQNNDRAVACGGSISSLRAEREGNLPFAGSVLTAGARVNCIIMQICKVERPIKSYLSSSSYNSNTKERQTSYFLTATTNFSPCSFILLQKMLTFCLTRTNTVQNETNSNSKREVTAMLHNFPSLEKHPGRNSLSCHCRLPDFIRIS